LIKYLKYEEIDKLKWDDCINKSCNGIIYAYSWYLDIVCPSWEALIEDDYEKVFPLTPRKKSGINYLFQPFFTQQLGIFSRNEMDKDAISGFINKIPGKYKFIEINFNTFNKPDTEKFNFIPNLTYELDLRPSYETINQNYSENLKRNIKQALKSGITLKSFSDTEQVIQLFRKNKGKGIKTLKNNDFLTLVKIVNTCISKHNAYINAAYNREEEIIAGAIFLISNKKIIFLFSGASDEAKTTGAMSYLIDSTIKEHAHCNLTLDFEGSNNANLARFYKSFGADERTYFHYKKNELPLILSKSITFIKWIRN
jgi:hypothetical protein